VVHSLTTGVAAYLSDRVHEQMGLQARFLRPGLIGRAVSSCVSETDRQEAWAVGEQAVAHLAAGRSGSMVALERTSDEPYLCITGLASLTNVANAEKLLPPGFINGSGNMVSEAFWTYAEPLIDGPLPPLARLQGKRVAKQALS
jgi:6-phosphofructokinase 1